MELLQAGVDRALIALWLGHESVETTQIYCAQKGDMCSACPSLLIGKACASGNST
jgi:integrase